MKIELQPGESKIDTWSSLYYPPGGKRYKGKLTVTNRRLLYDAVFDVSARGLMSETLFVRWGSTGYLEIDKTEIKQVDVIREIFYNKAVLTLADGSKHVFNYRLWSIKKVVDAINFR